MKFAVETNLRSHLYAPQLQIRGYSLAPGKEWTPQMAGWALFQVGSGSGYWLLGQARRELEIGAVVLAAGEAPARLLASRLNGMSLHFFTVMPERLTGLITQGEQDYIGQAAGRGEFFRVLEPQNPVALRMKELCDNPGGGGLLSRLILLQLWVEAFGQEWQQSEPQAQADVKERLRMFLLETPTDALLEISFEDLAQILHCTPRHLSRVFYEVAGTSFRDKRAEIRLNRARELLATSQSKVVDVAFKSGFKSLSLFNRMFTRRFGISPGRWRQKNGDGVLKETVDPRRGRTRVSVSQRRLVAV